MTRKKKEKERSEERVCVQRFWGLNDFGSKRERFKMFVPWPDSSLPATASLPSCKRRKNQSNEAAAKLNWKRSPWSGFDSSTAHSLSWYFTRWKAKSRCRA